MSLPALFQGFPKRKLQHCNELFHRLERPRQGANCHASKIVRFKSGKSHRTRAGNRTPPPAPLEYTPPKNVSDQKPVTGTASSFGFAPGVRIPTSPFADSQGKAVKTESKSTKGGSGFGKRGISYKSASRRILAIMITTPILLVTSWHLYTRLVLGEEQKVLLSQEERERIKEANRQYTEMQTRRR